MTKTEKKAPARAVWLALISAVCLVIPGFNIIDVFPDFIAYIILAWVFRKYVDYAPYFAEARQGFVRLAVVSALKIPALVLMVGAMGFGGDSIALFTLVFAVLELMLLFPAISSAFSALYYVGERGNCPATISQFGRGRRPDDLKTFSYIFVAAKSLLGFIPSLFLLTRATDTSEEIISAIKMRMAFPVATVGCMAASLAIGIAWAVLAFKYVLAIASEGKLTEAAVSIAGEERLKELSGERYVKRILRTMTLLIVSAALCFDVTFSGINAGVNILPHCLFALLIIALCYVMTDKAAERTVLTVGGAVYSVISVAASVLLKKFATEYYYTDLGSVRAADKAYLYAEVGAVLELLAFALFITVYAKTVVAFILKHTTLKLSDDRFSRTDAEFVRKMKIKSYIFAYFPLLIAALKCAETFIRAKVRYVVPQSTSEAEVKTIVTSVAPWFGFLILGVCIAYLFYSYYFISGVKDEVKLKYSNEKQSFE